MTSAITIVNDSVFDMTCKIGPDEAALQIFGYVTAGIAALAAVVVSLGSAAPTLAAVGAVAANNALIIPGLASAIAITEAAAALTGVAVAKTAVSVLASVVTFIVKDFENDGFVKIPAGGSHRWDGLTLSLWQQGHCTRVRQVDEEMKAIIDEVFMRPIFSGWCAGCNNDHNIQFWVDKFGYENEQVIVVNPPEGMESWGDVNAQLMIDGTSAPGGGIETGTFVPTSDGSIETGTFVPSDDGSSGTGTFFPSNGDSSGMGTLVPSDDGSSGIGTLSPSNGDSFGSGTLSPSNGGSDFGGRLLRKRKL